MSTIIDACQSDLEDPSCGLWALAGLQLLEQSLAGSTKGGAVMTAARDDAEWSKILERCLLEQDMHEALQILDDYARRNGANTVLPDLMVATIRRLEHLWSTERVPEVKLTMAFAKVRQLIEVWKSQDQMVRPAGRSNARHVSLLVCTAPGDLHTFGAQILCDDLKLRGWDVDLDLSADADTLLDRVARLHYRTIMISIGQDASLAKLSDLIVALKIVSKEHEVFILIGGPGLAQPYSQYQFLGADMIAASAAQGAEFLASRLTSSAFDRGIQDGEI